MPSTEFQLIDWIRRSAEAVGEQPPSALHRLETGIGDDCAVVRTPSGDRLLIACDQLVEGVHFDLAQASAEAVGRKALAVNLSDIAAMGGVPTLCLVALAVERENAERLTIDVMQGVQALANRFDLRVVGGDLSRAARGSMTISVTVLGAASNSTVHRRGARPSDALFVTGELGGSVLGRHLSFEPRVREGLLLAETHGVTSMIDVSDGLIQDLGHLLEAEGYGAELTEAELPIAEAAVNRSQETGRTPLSHALYDGEDFELLFTAPASNVEGILADRALRSGVCKIGTITPQSGIYLVDESGRRVSVEAGGHDHFRD